MTEISVEELMARRAHEPDLLVVDVREPYEFEEFHIPALNIPLAELPLRFEEILDHREGEVILCCRSGNRSRTAREYLLTRGFKTLRVLTGGVAAWQKVITRK